MRIAQISPLIESVPPKKYGGTERVVSWLTEELVKQGHDVTLFASGDSITEAELIPCSEQALRLDPRCKDTYPHLMMMLDTVRSCAHEFDIVHFHVEFFHLPFFRQIGDRTLTTLHSRQDFHDYGLLYKAYNRMPLAAISRSQASAIPMANVTNVIHHGLPANLFKANLKPKGDYLAFLGRIALDKRPDRAIEIARAAGIPLKIAAKIDSLDEAYYREKIKPMMDNGPGVEFIGEVNEREKQDFLGNARALLFPIDWPEPFGLVMIEAMACGTPVLAFRNGSVPEVIDEGVTGHIVDTVEQAIEVLPQTLALDRKRIRAVFDERFTAARMARDYVKLYRRLLKKPAPNEIGRINGTGAGLTPQIYVNHDAS
ncbi:MAG TPA: glycosyltransferase family 4 protein [Xanthobacteraceae bacterium]|nr:glycosyltransferase family 4 protein [Xanthobacteraceae bacterium]